MHSFIANVDESQVDGMQVISDEAVQKSPPDMFCEVNMHALRTYVYDSQVFTWSYTLYVQLYYHKV